MEDLIFVFFLSVFKSVTSSDDNITALFICLTETPPPGYISEDGEASDQQMNQSMDTGTLD